MCRILKVLVVAEPNAHADLRRRLSSLEYDIVAMIAPGDEFGGTADVALVIASDDAVVAGLQARGVKVVTVGTAGTGDLVLDDPDEFRSRVWELFRAR